MNSGSEAEMGDQARAVLQEAIDATANLYASDAGVDVDEHLRRQMSSRGIDISSDEWISETAHKIRSGHDIRVGPSDGSMD